MKNLIILLFLFSFILGFAETSLKKVPEFSLKTIDGKTIKPADYLGKVLIINFFATWCPPCRAEIPDFVEFFNENKNDVMVIGICVWSKKSDLEKLIKEFRITYPVCMSDGKVEKDFGGLVGVPTTFIIDRNGYILKKILGSLDKNKLKTIQQQLK